MNAFVAIEYDVEKLRADILSRLEPESVVCTGLYEWDEAELVTLRQADTIYFVASKTSMCSTAYQILLFATFSLVNTQNCRLLKLDDTEIPAGFPLLQMLPEGNPIRIP